MYYITYFYLGVLLLLIPGEILSEESDIRYFTQYLTRVLSVVENPARVQDLISKTRDFGSGGTARRRRNGPLQERGARGQRPLVSTLFGTGSHSTQLHTPQFKIGLSKCDVPVSCWSLRSMP